MLYLQQRTVPTSTLIHVFFGNTYSLMGLGVLAFSWLFCVIFLSKMNLNNFSFSDESPIVQAVVNEVKATGSSQNKSKIYAYHYTYMLQQQNFSGVSYESYSSVKSGATVDIQYLADNPSISRIKGMRSSEFGIWVFFVLIFPIFGLVMTLVGFKEGRRAIKLLKNGELTYGKLLHSEQTNTRINNRHVYKMTFEFQTKEGRKHTIIAKTHLTELLTDEAQEQILYLPDQPEYAMTLDEMTGCPRLKNENEVMPLSFAKALLYLIAPSIFLLEVFLTVVL